jgi:hypothetical protein
MTLSTPAPTQVFVDPTGRRASRLRWSARIVGVLIALYALLLVGSLARMPGTQRLNLPGVRGLFPEAQAHPVPSVDQAASVTVLAVAGSRGQSGTTNAPSSTLTPATSGSHPNSVPAATAPAATPASSRGNGNGNGTGTGTGNGGTTPATSRPSTGPPATTGSPSDTAPGQVRKQSNDQGSGGGNNTSNSNGNHGTGTGHGGGRPG